MKVRDKYGKIVEVPEKLGEALVKRGEATRVAVVAPVKPAKSRKADKA